MYKTQRNYENLNKAIFDGTGQYGIPVIQATDYKADNWIGFNYAKGCEEPEIHGVHFFLDDYQFIRVWSQPDVYLNMLQKFQAVCTPDFSLYTDFPRVIPTICWSDEDSFEWCFDGEPIGSTVAVSSVGTQVNKEAGRLFKAGYEEMLRRLRPKEIIMYGNIPEWCEGNIIPVRAFQEKFRRQSLTEKK